HGPATDRNTHPHMSHDGQVAVIHNGVIENYAILKRQLIAEGIPFASDTDTEVIANLIAQHLDGDDIVGAIRKTLPMLKGTYGLGSSCRPQPGTFTGARLGSPLVLGIGNDENFLASDPSALVGSTGQVVFLDDRQLCVVKADRWHIEDANQEHVEARIQTIK